MNAKITPAGFTLIELIVVFSVIAILSTAGLAAFVDYSRQQTINTVAQEIKTAIFDARSRASSQVSICSTGQKFNGYWIVFCPKNSDVCPSCSVSNSYQMDIECNNSSILVNGTSKPLPPNITITTDSHSILFGPLSGNVVSPCDNINAASWNIAVGGYGKTPQTMTVFNTGLIK